MANVSISTSFLVTAAFGIFGYLTFFDTVSRVVGGLLVCVWYEKSMSSLQADPNFLLSAGFRDEDPSASADTLINLARILFGVSLCAR